MEIRSVKVRVPGTSANCGPGFDCLGVACTIYNELELTLLEEERLDIEITGDGAENIPVDERNIVWRRSTRGLLSGWIMACPCPGDWAAALQLL